MCGLGGSKLGDSVFSLLRTHLLICGTAIVVSFTLRANSATARVWTVPDSMGTQAIAADLNPNSAGLIVAQGNLIARISVSGEHNVLAGHPNGYWGVVDGIARSAEFSGPKSIAIDKTSGQIVIADTGSDTIRNLDPVTKAVTTIAGRYRGRRYRDPISKDGIGPKARLNHSQGIAVGRDGVIYFADSESHLIRRLDPLTKAVTTIAGNGQRGSADGKGREARFAHPMGLAVDAQNKLIIADYCNDAIRQLDLTTGEVTTIAGTREKAFADGPAMQAKFANPTDVAIDPQGKIIIADSGNNRIRSYDPKTRIVTTIAGTGEKGDYDGPRNEAKFHEPTQVVVWPTGGIFVAQAKGPLRFIAPDDQLEIDLVKLHNAIPTAYWASPEILDLHDRVLKTHNRVNQYPPALAHALRVVNQSALRTGNYLGLLPKDVQNELSNNAVANSVNYLRLAMAFGWSGYNPYR